MEYSLRRALRKIQKLLVNTGIHRKFPIIVKIYDYLFRLLGPNKNIITIQGSKMLIDTTALSPSLRKTFQSYAINRIHEEATTELFKEKVKKGDVVLDLGANIGYFTLLAASIVGERGRIYSFEPEPRNFEYLSINIELNNYKNVTITQKAVSDREGITQLYLCSYDTGHHTINKYDGIKASLPANTEESKISIDIETVTVDNFLVGKEEFVDIIKMDVEGAELLALNGMEKIINQSLNLKMFIEFFPLLIEKMGNSPREFIDKLLNVYKFTVYVIGNDYDAQNRELLKITDIEHLLKLCKGIDDHLNLYLEKK